MASPSVTLNSPSNSSTVTTLTPALSFTGTDADGDAVTYQLQIDTSTSFNSSGGNPLLDVTSDNALGFSDGGTIALADPFNQTTLDTTKWTQTTGGGATASYSATGATFSYPGSSTASTIAKITSVNPINLTSNSVALHLIARPNTATNADSMFRLEAAPDTFIRIVNEQGSSYFQLFVGGALKYNSYNYDGSFTTKYWRIRHSSGTLYMDISANGVTWTTPLSTATNGMAVTALSVIVEASCYNNQTSPGTFQFNNFNIPVTHASGTAITYTAPTLSDNTTYYWRVRAKDPAGSNTYGGWASYQSFTVSTGGTNALKVWNGSSWGLHPAKVFNGSSWVTKPAKRWNGSSWVPVTS